MRYAFGVSACLALLALARSYGIDLRVAGFASMVFFVVLVPVLLFSRLTEVAPNPVLKWPAVVMLWASVMICIACWLCLFTSVFWKVPLDLRSWLLATNSTNSTSVAIGRPSQGTTQQPAATFESVVVPVVSIHVGGDDSKQDRFVYDAPAGSTIKGYKIIERTKGGDAHYSAGLLTASKLEIDWSVHSHTVKALGIVVDTHTAALALDVEITLQK